LTRRPAALQILCTLQKADARMAKRHLATALIALGLAGCAAAIDPVTGLPIAPTTAPSGSASAAPAQGPSGPAPLTFAAPPPFMPAQLNPAAVNASDNFLWLEEVQGTRALQWVRQQNARTDRVLKADPRYAGLRADALAILTAQDRTPVPNFRGGGIDNFWQDADHTRGLWRRTTLESYRSAEPEWETILDIDALSRRERANWIWKGADCLEPAERICLVRLSDGGKDAVVVREFDTETKQFVRNGFSIPEGKHSITWLNETTILIATDFGAGTLTESGYPFIVKAIQRGQRPVDGLEVFRGAATDGGYGVDPLVMRDAEGKVLAVMMNRPLDTFRTETWLVRNPRPVKLNLPERVTVRGMLAGAAPRLVFTVEEPWRINGQAVPAGALMAVNLSMLAPSDTLSLTNRAITVFQPNARQSVEDVAVFDSRIVATVYDNVRGRAVSFADTGAGGAWVESALPVPQNAAVHLGSTSRSTGRLFYTVEGFLTPPTLSLASISATSNSATAQTIREAPARFDASKHVVEQFEAVSRDGARIPYFVVRPKDAPLDGSIPTMMFGYGGFQVSYPPVYKAELGKLWLERGGAYVIANIRGGGEFGPAWHEAALDGNRQRAFDDFAAVAADLATRRITSAKHLAIYGRSNGGVLTSVTLTQHPELIGAAVIESPLVDMLRYHELPPGASWIGEYGDPRIAAEAQWIAAYSAYQNLRPDMNYPQPYITTNMRDDRVHPGHARKFAARMQAMGYPVLYYENTDGGHANDSDPVVNADRWARHYTYLTQRLVDDPPTGDAPAPEPSPTPAPRRGR
jgi:prolyl oligopeptidase